MPGEGLFCCHKGITHIFSLSGPVEQSLGSGARTLGFLCELPAPSNSWVWKGFCLSLEGAEVHRGHPGLWPGHSLASCHPKPAQ